MVFVYRADDKRLIFSNLRQQQRIRIHVNLFVALSFDTLFAIISLRLHTIPAYQSLVEDQRDSAVSEMNSIQSIHKTSFSTRTFRVLREKK